MPKTKNSINWIISREEHTDLTLLTCPRCHKSLYYDILKTYDKCPFCGINLSNENKEK